MSADTCSWVGSNPRFKMWRMSGKHHLSNKSAIQPENDVPEVGDKAAFFAIASFMSLWRNSGSQGSACALPRIVEVRAKSPAIQKSTEHWKTEDTRASTVNTIGTKSLNLKQGYRSKVNSCNPTTKTNINQLDTGKLPVNSTTGNLSRLGIAKDFGIHQNLIFTILKDASTTEASAGQLLQDSKNQRMALLGKCDTVQLSTNEKRKEKKSLQVQASDFGTITFENSGISVLSVLPVLSCVLQANQFCEILGSQVHAIKYFISCVVTIRLLLLGTILKQCERLARQGHLKVNQTDIIRENSEKANIKQAYSVSGANNFNPKVVVSMENRVGNQINGIVHQGEEMMEENGFWDGEDGGEQELPNNDDLNNIINAGNDEAGFDDEFAFNMLMAGNGIDVHPALPHGGNQAVPEAVAVAPHAIQIENDFASQLICDYDRMEALLQPVNDPEQGLPPPPPQFHLDEDDIELFMDDMEVDPQLLQHLEEILELDHAYPPNAA